MASLAVFYFLPAWTARIPLIVGGGLLALATVAWFGAWWDARIWRAKRPRRFAGYVSGGLTLLTGHALFLAVLLPPKLSLVEPAPSANAHARNLPTGSRIVYKEYAPPSGIPTRPEPLLFLHGGPGLATDPFDEAFYKQFSTDGFRVYLFDQAGGGLSGRLPHASEYSRARAVADLEAIRQAIGATQMVLIGQSWGCTLAANYMALYPEHVAKVVFNSPGPIWNFTSLHFDYSRTAAMRSQWVSPSLRVRAALSLYRRNPDAAENLVSQREMSALSVAFLDARPLVCKGDAGKVPPGDLQPSGLNLYATYGIGQQIGREDPHAVLRRNQTPALLAYAECDYFDWDNVLDYRRTFPNLKVLYFARAGHAIQLSQPELLAGATRNFLLGAPDAMPSVQTDVDPRPAKDVAPAELPVR
jgi:pimeloyl-ACP methyl ester carboxylesterase